MPKVVSRDGTAIAFERIGQGPAVILVDGALCSRAFGPMPKLAPLLARHFTVYMYDRRGRGQSDDTAPYAPEREVEDIAALIKEAGGSASLVGLSSGAALALEAAATGLNVRKVVAFEPPYMVDKNGRRPPVDHREQLSRMIAEGRRGDAIKFFMRELVGLPGIFVVIMRLMPGMWRKLSAVAHTLPYDATIMGDYSLPRHRFAGIAVPTLALDGEKSDIRLRRAVHELAKAVPNAEHRTLQGQSHNAKAEVLAPALIEFLAN